MINVVWIFVNALTRGVGIFLLWLVIMLVLNINFEAMSFGLTYVYAIGLIGIVSFIGVRIITFDFYKAINEDFEKNKGGEKKDE